MKLTLALLLLGVEGQYRSRRNRVVDGNPQPPRGLPRRLQNSTGNATGNDTATTAAPATTPPTTAAPTTVAATAAPTTVAATAAPTTAGATPAPTAAPTTVAATQAPTTAAATTAAAAGNGTNVTAIPTATVSTVVKMTVKLDLSLYDAGQKTAIGNAFAFGIHASTCKGVASMWNTLGQCMMGVGKVEGVTFGMGMAISAKLAASGQPGCTSATDCYGDVTPAPARQLAAEDIENSGTFSVTATGADVVAQAQTAQTALKAAESGGTFSAANIATEVATAIARPSMNSTLGSVAAAITKAAEEATVVVETSAVVGDTPAPSGGSTSDAYTAGVTGVFALVFGALLF